MHLKGYHRRRVEGADGTVNEPREFRRKEMVLALHDVWCLVGMPFMIRYSIWMSVSEKLQPGFNNEFFVTPQIIPTASGLATMPAVALRLFC